MCPWSAVTAGNRGLLMRDALSQSDRIFVIAFGASLAVHLVFLITRVVNLPWLIQVKDRLPIEVVYETAQSKPEVERFEATLARAKRDSLAAPSPSQIGERMQIRIPDRPFLAGERSLAEAMPARGAIVDLTDLVDASRGDPVLLSYFGSIREQIQATANRQSWAIDESAGLIFISFLLSADGSVSSIAIVTERSASSQVLRDVSLSIVKASAPFLPFPPSMKEDSKTIVVPLEFSSS